MEGSLDWLMANPLFGFLQFAFGFFGGIKNNDSRSSPRLAVLVQPCATAYQPRPSKESLFNRRVCARQVFRLGYISGVGMPAKRASDAGTGCGPAIRRRDALTRRLLPQLMCEWLRVSEKIFYWMQDRENWLISSMASRASGNTGTNMCQKCHMPGVICSVTGTPDRLAESANASTPLLKISCPPV